MRRFFLGILLAFLLLSLSISANASSPGEVEKRTTLIAYIANPSTDINRIDNSVYLHTYYFGSFSAKIPENCSVETLIQLEYEYIKVTFNSPVGRFPSPNFMPPIEVASMEVRDRVLGRLLAKTDDYIEIELISLLGDGDNQDGEVRRFVMNGDTAMSRPIDVGMNVEIVHETDENDACVALLIAVGEG